MLPEQVKVTKEEAGRIYLAVKSQLSVVKTMHSASIFAIFEKLHECMLCLTMSRVGGEPLIKQESEDYKKIKRAILAVDLFIRKVVEIRLYAKPDLSSYLNSRLDYLRYFTDRLYADLSSSKKSKAKLENLVRERSAADFAAAAGAGGGGGGSVVPVTLLPPPHAVRRSTMVIPIVTFNWVTARATRLLIRFGVNIAPPVRSPNEMLCQGTSIDSIPNGSVE
jgi:hypothetical protein